MKLHKLSLMATSVNCAQLHFCVRHDMLLFMGEPVTLAMGVHFAHSKYILGVHWKPADVFTLCFIFKHKRHASTVVSELCSPRSESTLLSCPKSLRIPLFFIIWYKLLTIGKALCSSCLRCHLSASHDSPFWSLPFIHFFLPGTSQGSPVILPTSLASSQDDSPEIQLKNSLRVREMDPQVKGPTKEASNPEFRSLHLCKKLGMVVCTCNLRDGKAQTGWPLGLIGNQLSLNQSVLGFWKTWSQIRTESDWVGHWHLATTRAHIYMPAHIRMHKHICTYIHNISYPLWRIAFGWCLPLSEPDCAHLS